MTLLLLVQDMIYDLLVLFLRNVYRPIAFAVKKKDP